MDRHKNLRNIAIIVLLAVAVWKLPGGGTAAQTVSNMEHRDTIFGLEERQRALLYGALALIAFALAATRRMWTELDVLGTMLWLAMLGAAVWAIYSVWQAYRTY